MALLAACGSGCPTDCDHGVGQSTVTSKCDGEAPVLSSFPWLLVGPSSSSAVKYVVPTELHTHASLFPLSPAGVGAESRTEGRRRRMRWWQRSRYSKRAVAGFCALISGLLLCWFVRREPAGSTHAQGEGLKARRDRDQTAETPGTIEAAYQRDSSDVG